MNNKIGFFGGCFNPPSNIHINIAKNLINTKQLDKIVFIPVGDFYEKAGLEKAIHRINMLKLAIQNYKNFEVDDIELRMNKKLYAVDIFEEISKRYKGNDIYFIMGSDNYSKMPKWKAYDEIKDKYKYIVVERDNEDINSTIIREMIANNISVENIISENIYNYINEHNLYKK